MNSWSCASRARTPFTFHVAIFTTPPWSGTLVALGLASHVLASLREQAGRSGEIEVRDQQPLLAIRVVAEQRSVGIRDCRRTRRSLTRGVHRGEVARVLGGTAQHRLFVERVLRIGVTDGPIATRLRFVKV